MPDDQEPGRRPGARRYVLTGAPGAGKTTVLRALRDRGFAIIEEAATDVIAAGQQRGVAEPWRAPDFIDKIVALQCQRQQEPPGRAAQQPTAQQPTAQVYDRSPLCTLALALFLDRRVTPALASEVERVKRERVYERRVFFVRPLGFIEPTAARRISYEESLAFERLHEKVYREHGFEAVDVPPGAVTERAAFIAGHLTRMAAYPRTG